MKRIVLTLFVLFILAGCGGREEESSSASPETFDLAQWNSLRMNLPKELVEPDVFLSPVLTTPEDEEAARAFSLALAQYIPWGEGKTTPQEFGNDFYLATGLFHSRGTEIGQPGATDPIFRQLERQYLDGQTGFITKEEVEWVVWQLFGEEITLEHHSLGGAEGYTYLEELGIYLRPETQPVWQLPVVLTTMTTREEYIADLVLAEYSDSEGNAFYDWQGQEIARWDFFESLTRNLEQYTCYQAALAIQEDGSYQLAWIEQLPVADYPDFQQ